VGDVSVDGKTTFNWGLEECGLNRYRDLFPPETYGEPLASIETEFMYRLSNCRVERVPCGRGSKN
jgi:hypothetical protein